MSKSITAIKKSMALQGRKVTATKSKMNDKQCYSVNGISGEYTVDGLIWQFGL